MTVVLLAVSGCTAAEIAGPSSASSSSVAGGATTGATVEPVSLPAEPVQTVTEKLQNRDGFRVDLTYGAGNWSKVAVETIPADCLAGATKSPGDGPPTDAVFWVSKMQGSAAFPESNGFVWGAAQGSLKVTASGYTSASGYKFACYPSDESAVTNLGNLMQISVGPEVPTASIYLLTWQAPSPNNPTGAPPSRAPSVRSIKWGLHEVAK